MHFVRAIWSWVLDWLPYALPALANGVLVFLGVWLSLPDFAQKVQDNPTYRKLLAGLCITLGFIGMVADVRARHDSDRSSKQLMGNTTALVDDTKKLIATTNESVGNTKTLVNNTTDMVNGLADTLKRVRGMSASLQQTQRVLAEQTEFLNHMDLHVVSVKEFAKKAQQLSATVNNLADEYNWKINTGAGLSYWDHLEGERSTPQEIAQLKRDMEKAQGDYRQEYRKEAAKIMVQVGPICEELVRRLDPSDRTQQDKKWTTEFASIPADATSDMQDLAQYLQELSTRVLQKELLTEP